MKPEERLPYYAARFAEIPPDIRAKAIDALKYFNEKIAPEETERVKKLFEQYGLIEWFWHLEDDAIAAYEKEEGHKPQFWISPHMGIGMSIRNLLRSEGLSDESLPNKNWDDYYVPVLEAALGFREVPA